MLEQLSELGQSVYLTDCWFNIKRQLRKRFIKKDMRKRPRASMLSLVVPLSPNIPVFTNLEFSEPCPFGVLRRLRYTVMVD